MVEEAIRNALNRYAGQVPAPIQSDELAGCIKRISFYRSRGAFEVRGGGCFEVNAVSYAHVAACVRKKTGKLPCYRLHADAVALLIYCPMAPSQAQLAVPAEADTWRFEHGFERVVLYARDSSGTGIVFR